MLRPGGRVVTVAEPSVEGSVYFIVEPNRDQLERVAKRIDDGTLRPPPIEPLPLVAAPEAFLRSLQPNRAGKVVLVP